jgi:cell division protein FtsW (lipid II flippase)
VITASSRRAREFGLGLLAIIITGGGYVLVALADEADLPPDLWVFFAAMAGLFLVAHLAMRRFAKRADGTILPLAMLLTGVGFVTISRLDDDLGRLQAVWTAVAVAAFVITLIGVRRVRTLERFRYTCLALGLAALLLPLVPGVGREINGARLWVQIGPLNIQPGELAKILLVVFFAAYLVDKRELLSAGTLRLGRIRLPDPKHLGPLMMAWGVSIIVMVMEKDLGSSLLFFAVFTAMLYMATVRLGYVIVAALLLVVGAAIGYQIFGHVQERVEIWLDPWPTAETTGYQIVQSWFAFGTGGFAGTGFGLGSPDKIPNVETDFVFSAIGEELGMLGTVGVLIGFLLFVGAGYRIAVQARRDFPKLFAAGLTTIVGVQAFIIIAGVTRVIPLTGITLPFVSYGGSSLVANFIAVALLARISDESVAEAERAASRGPVRQRAGAGR